ncbi:MAG TPA: hypothetical protein VD929_09105 [Caulobacteraceae bacterium]|nr:hypothetical protein [Caulobacteraceae bacterium]
MRVSAALAAVLFLAANSAACAADDLTSLGDEFDASAVSPDWKLFHAEYGWPDKIKALDVGVATPGALRMEPLHSAWVRDLNAPFLFKTVSGDFDVRARVRTRGANGPIPGGTWSLGGLMARVPNGVNAGAWSPRAENWHFITTGVGLEPGVPVTETKGTYNSYSSLKLRPWNSGWTELRLVRVGMTLFALAREDGKGPWKLRDRFYRMEPRPQMQVGLIAYTTSDDVPPGPENPEQINRAVNKEARVDMTLEVDWIRFSRPRFSTDLDWRAQVRGHPLADPNLPEAEILKALGD